MKFFTHSKKGGLQVSINAIIILVMAVVVIGLGITFITKMFTSGGVNLEKISQSYLVERQADYDNPFIMVKEIEIKRGKTVRVDTSLYNKDSGSVTYTLTLRNSNQCKTMDGTPDSSIKTSLGADGMALPVDGNSEAAFDFAITGNNIGAYTCDFQITGTPATQGASAITYTGSMLVQVTG